MNYWEKYAIKAWFRDVHRRNVREIFVGQVRGRRAIDWFRIAYSTAYVLPEFDTQRIPRTFDRRTAGMDECGMRGAP